MRYANDPDGRRLPIKLDTTTNGEFAPIPLDAVHHHARALAMERAAHNARRTAKSRRDFLVSACGAATTLLAFNDAFGATGGGYYDLPREAALDAMVARSSLDKGEFVFDVQGHFVNPTGAWTKSLPPTAQPLRFATNRANCTTRDDAGLASLGCIGRDAFLKDVFLDSDTDVIVLSFVPSTREQEPLTMEEAVASAAIVEGMKGTHRMLVHGRVNPNQAGDLESMDMLAQQYKVAAFKTYTQWGPDGKGFFLDDDAGIAFIEKARKLGVRNIAVHKGLPFGPQSYEHSTCVDVGRVAKRFPDMNFLIYHSGFVAGKPEGAYDASRTDGIDALITSLLKNDVKPGSNVYAELGSTWRFLMRDPEASAHAIGKLVKHCGEGNVLWGTDSIWYGSPQDQIQAFRTFQISESLAARHGYTRMTPQLRAKIFGRNALAVYSLPDNVLREHLRADRVTRERENYRNAPDPTFATRGPRTRREFMNLAAWSR